MKASINLCICIIIVLTASPLLILSQARNSIPLHIGDTLPNVSIDNILNYPAESAKLSDFEGKVVILDFWNMSCGPCISGFPKLSEIQERFQGEIQILLVNPLDKVDNLKKMGFPDKVKSPVIRNTKLPFILGDKVLYSFFEINTMPYQVILDRNRKIIAISDGSGTTLEQIEKAIAGKKIELRYQNNLSDLGLVDALGTANRYKSIFQPQSKVLSENLLFSSLITKNIGGKGFNELIYDSASRRLIGKRFCGSPDSYFKFYFSNQNLVDNADRVVFEPVELSVYATNARMSDEEVASYYKEQVYASEVIFPVMSLSGDFTKDYALIDNTMIQNLENVLSIKGKVERRKMACRVLVFKGNAKKLPTSQESYYFEKAPKFSGLTMRKGNIQTLIGELQYALYNPQNPKPLLDESGISTEHLFDMELNVPLYDLDKIRAALSKYGFDIIEKEREVDVLVIKRANTNWVSKTK